MKIDIKLFQNRDGSINVDKLLNFKNETTKKRIDALFELEEHQLNEAARNIEKVTQEFYHLVLEEGDTISRAFEKIGQRYATNPYVIQGVEARVTGDIKTYYQFTRRGIDERS